MTTRHTTAGGAGRRPDASMTLLNEVYSSSLDEGYALVAARRAAGTAPRPHAARRAVILVVAVGVGLASSAAAIALHQPTAAAQEARELLESSIVERNDEAAELQEEVASLSSQIAALQSALIGPESTALQQAATVGAVEAGQVPVAGPGLRVELSDAPDADPDAGDDDARVQDVDLQIVVNGLWSAGAEAIAINDQRVTATTAIRSAGSAVLVDLVPLSGPYRVEALGNPVELQTGLARDTAGQLLTALRSTYGIGVDISRQDSLWLPGAGQVTLRHATVPDDGLPAELRPTPTPKNTPDAAVDSPSGGTVDPGSGDGEMSLDASAVHRAGDAPSRSVSSRAARVAGSATHAAALPAEPHVATVRERGEGQP
ncbi:DUF881 domain-containing protein [Cellulomonas palmilytica]|uniref:DUF881 domain-containing protein n=1 Tax=Cellulomonas palmilytica TaxID=2608402 RepID=UPI001F41C890|nr:DUF881 domain-containing protein [Cellulomonas palmilytica]